YLLNEGAATAEAPPAAVPATPAMGSPTFEAPVEAAPPAEEEGLPPWLRGAQVGVPPAQAEPEFSLDVEERPSWLYCSPTVPAEPPPALPEATPVEPAAAEVFGGEDLTAWPAPAEALPAPPSVTRPGTA